MCQCPEWGDLHFYLDIAYTVNGKRCVNALKGATFISTEVERQIAELQEKLCQCPERGDLHFYERMLIPAQLEAMCQCPERGDLHFYCNFQRDILFVGQDVSMP